MGRRLQDRGAYSRCIQCLGGHGNLKATPRHLWAEIGRTWDIAALQLVQDLEEPGEACGVKALTVEEG